MTRNAYRICGLTGIVGGILWIWKAGSILLTGVQPPYIFELAGALAAISLVGLYAVAPVHSSWSAKIGLTMAILALAARVLDAVYMTLVDRPPSSREGFDMPGSLFQMIGGFGVFLAIFLITIPAIRSQETPRLDRQVLTASVVVCIAAPFLGVLNIEAPILVIGCVWCALGVVTWRLA